MVANAMTVDLEDWYQGIEQPFESWERFQDRISIGTDRLLSIFDETNTRATFFVLGWLAEKHPALIRRIADAGHEIASHGYDHEKLYNTTAQALRMQLGRAKQATEDVIGQAVNGHRAPYFSLTSQSLWAVEVLNDLGFTYDASVYPGANWRYGIPGSPEQPYLLNDTDLVEFPVSILSLRGRRLGIGGAYFRILPLSMTRNAIKTLNDQGQVVSFYVHPWELDPRHPLVRFRWKAMLTHYFNLPGTAPRLKRLLTEMRFTSMSEIIQQMRQQQSLERITL
jgi:polysaccharide deacetylase family protein (PEP-CTERM system associated)